MKIYFAGSIRGSRKDQEKYGQIIDFLKNRGDTVLSEHIGQMGLGAEGESHLLPEEIRARDLKWLKESDLVVAEVTTPSIGVGIEIGKAEEWGKTIFCLFRPNQDYKLSAMVAGSDEVKVLSYQTIDDLAPTLERSLRAFEAIILRKAPT